jgi:hypothetical protein
MPHFIGENFLRDEESTEVWLGRQRLLENGEYPESRSELREVTEAEFSVSSHEPDQEEVTFWTMEEYVDMLLTSNNAWRDFRSLMRASEAFVLEEEREGSMKLLREAVPKEIDDIFLKIEEASQAKSEENDQLISELTNYLDAELITIVNSKGIRVLPVARCVYLNLKELVVRNVAESSREMEKTDELSEEDREQAIAEVVVYIRRLPLLIHISGQEVAPTPNDGTREHTPGLNEPEHRRDRRSIPELIRTESGPMSPDLVRDLYHVAGVDHSEAPNASDESARGRLDRYLSRERQHNEPSQSRSRRV